MHKRNEKKKWILAGIGAAVTLVTLLLILLVFATVSRPNEEKLGVSLWDMEGQSNGWTYEVLSEGKNELVEPQFPEEAFGMVFPAENITAIKISRMMTEDIPLAEMEMQLDFGTEIFMDNELLYSDFQSSERDEFGYLLLSDTERSKFTDRYRAMTISLPEDYTGRELTIVTYYPDICERYFPPFPTIENEEANIAIYSAEAVIPMAVMTISAIIVILLEIIFCIELWYGKRKYSILLLVLFFMCFFMETVCNALVGGVNSLSDKVYYIVWQGIYVIPLCMYIAMNFTSWRKWITLSGGMIVLLAVGKNISDTYIEGGEMYADVNDLEIFLLFLLTGVMLVFECVFCREKQKRWLKPRYLLVLAGVVFVCIKYNSYKSGDDNVGMYMKNMLEQTKDGTYISATILISSVFAFMAVILLVVKFIENIIYTKQMTGILEERNKIAMENYKMAIRSFEDTREKQHEFRHHMEALTGLLQEEETKKAEEYIKSVLNQIDSIPKARYSKNIIVNAIAGIYLERAKKENIFVEYVFSVPEQINMKEEDLCVLLTNILENAVEACEQLGADKKKCIKIKMNMEGSYLFLSCENSMEGTLKIEKDGSIMTSKNDTKMHGYGIPALRKIAEKYGSIIKIDVTEEEFIIKTNLCVE